MTYAIEERAHKQTTRFFAFLAALAAVVLSAVVVVVVRNHAGTGSAGITRGAVGAPSAEGPAGYQGAGRGQSSATPAGQAVLTGATVSWHDFDGVGLPWSTAGPKHVGAGQASGFDRSPAGAVLAAIHLAYRVGSTPGPAVFIPTITKQVVGVDKERFLSNIQQEYDTNRARYGAGAGGELTTDIANARRDHSGMWAYRVEFFDPSTSTVQILLRAVPAGVPIYINLALALRWVNGDWRLEAPLNGQWSSVARQMPSVPDGYALLNQG